MDMQHEVLAKYKVTVFWGGGGGGGGGQKISLPGLKHGQKISLPGLKHGGVECITESTKVLVCWWVALRVIKSYLLQQLGDSLKILPLGGGGDVQLVISHKATQL